MSKNYSTLVSESVGLTPEKVRDTLAECISGSALSTLQASFKQVGGNYDRPTKKHLELVVQALGSQNSGLELVERHRSLLLVLIGELA